MGWKAGRKAQAKERKQGMNESPDKPPEKIKGEAMRLLSGGECADARKAWKRAIKTAPDPDTGETGPK